MNLFITGATGFIGTHFVNQLLPGLRSEDRVYLLTRSPSSWKDVRVEELSGDLSTLANYRDILSECDYVYHLAACAVYGNNLPYERLNFEPTRVLIEILRQSRKLQNFIFVSTIGAVDRTSRDRCDKPLTVHSIPCPRSRYGKSKLKAEEWVRSQEGLPYTIIRPAWVYGQRMREGSHLRVLAGMVSRKHPIRRLCFPGRVPLIHVEDLASALVRCLDNPAVIGKTYIAVTENLSIGTLLGEFSEVMEFKKPSQLRVPRLRFLFGRLHRCLPLSVSNLFLDYLMAEDDAFARDFGIQDPIHFRKGKDDVIGDLPERSSYWVVTGANSGIGYALFQKLKAAGEKLILVDKEIDCLPAHEAPGVLVIRSDLSYEESLKKLAAQLCLYRLKVLIHNAGVGWRGSVEEVSFDQIQKTLDVNVRAPIFLTKLLLGRLRSDHTLIVNVASSIAYNPLPGMSLYSASKVALSHWSRSLAQELRKTNTVLTLHPSGTCTRFQERAGVKVNSGGKGLLSADAVAQKIIESVRRRKEIPILSFSTRAALFFSSLLPERRKAEFWGRLFSRLR